MRLIAILLLVGLVCSCSVKENHETTNKTAPTSDNPDQISRNIKVLFIDSSFTKAILRAKRARIYQERMETLLDSGLSVEFMSRQSGKRISHLTADYAKIDDRTKNMFARGNVVVISDSSQRKLVTSQLAWNNATQRFYSTEFVEISSPQERIQGYGFESDSQLNNYKISRVSGEQK
jgi:LPS export ABC transporter protein LptC